MLIQSEKVVESLVKELRTQIPHLTRLCQAIGYLDMLASFAYLVSISDYCRPDMTSTVAMTSARHPIVEQVCWDRRHIHYYPLGIAHLVVSMCHNSKPMYQDTDS